MEAYFTTLATFLILPMIVMFPFKAFFKMFKSTI